MLEEHDLYHFYYKLDLLLMKNFGLNLDASYVYDNSIEITISYDNNIYRCNFGVYNNNYSYLIKEILDYTYEIISRNGKISDFIKYFGKEIEYELDD